LGFELGFELGLGLGLPLAGRVEELPARMFTTSRTVNDVRCSNFSQKLWISSRLPNFFVLRVRVRVRIG
jgi:hypothetical protein